MTSSQNTKFTIIIPTRERVDTLKWTLKTCLSQAYENLEIIVSDNFSQDGTREYVSSINDSRLRYINTGKRLSMSHNWEFALSHVQSGFVMFLGDDDGLLPGALKNLDGLIRESGARAVNWMSGSYGWPSCKFPGIRDTLKMGLGRGERWRNAQEVLDEVLNFSLGYAELPMAYGFFVERELLEKGRGPDGIFFRSMTPDIYSGIVVAAQLDRYLFSYEPYGLFGISHHSTGASQFNSSVDDQSVKRFYQEPNIPFHPKLELASSMAILTAECFYQAQAAVPDFAQRQVSVEAVVVEALKETATMPKETRQQQRDILLRIAEKNGLNASLKKKIRSGKTGLLDKLIPPAAWRNLRHKVSFDARKLSVTNIWEACEFAAKVKEQRRAGKTFIPERIGFIVDKGVSTLSAKLGMSQEFSR